MATRAPFILARTIECWIHAGYFVAWSCKRHRAAASSLLAAAHAHRECLHFHQLLQVNEVCERLAYYGE